jgi:hypothetical protein
MDYAIADLMGAADYHRCNGNNAEAVRLANLANRLRIQYHITVIAKSRKTI